MPSIALITYEQFPDLYEDDQLVSAVLQNLGFTVHPVVWNDPAVQWEQFDMAVMRSTWDYHEHFPEFLIWLARVEQATQLWNPPDLMRWNSEKTYLRDLEARGIPIVPSVWLERGATVDLAILLAEQGWDEVVVKPTVAGGAYATWRTSLAEAASHQAQFEADVQARPTIVQPFLAEIQTGGEWSFIFFNGEFSHVVLKKPAEGDFRVQEMYGGTSTIQAHNLELLRQAQKVIAAVDYPTLYARVDAVELAGQLTLMELEVIEPSLFLGTDSHAPQRFAEAIIERLNG